MKFDAITIGSATRDIFLESDSFKVLRDPRHLEKIGFASGEAQCFALGSKIEIKNPTLALGGGAANAAVTFARQGLAASALVKIGTDYNGSAVIHHLKREKVHPLALYDSKTGTSFSTILLSPDGERTILNYRGASEEMKISEINFGKLESRAAYVVPGHIAFGVLRSIFAHFRKSGCLISFNPSQFYIGLGLAKLKPMLRATDILILNREEAASLSGVSYHEPDSIMEKLNKICGGIVVMTDGARGVTVKISDKKFSAGIYRERKIVDRTGAGDAFGSGFTAYLLKNKKFKNRRLESQIKDQNFSEEEIIRAIRFGSANATSVVERVGAQEGILKTSQITDKRWNNLKVRIARWK